MVVATVVQVEARAGEVPKNVWIRSGADAFASTGANWSLGYAPTNTDAVVFLGPEAAIPDMTWNITNTVAHWVQALDYTGSVTVAKSKEMLFKVSGDIVLDSGVSFQLRARAVQTAHRGNPPIGADAMLT